VKIGGLQKLTLIDFPGHLAAVVFTKGCNFRCPYCHNRDLVLGNLPTISQRTVFSFLKKRKNILTGVAITGGEPFLQPDLTDFISKVKQLGYKVKLDTNGSFPEHLKKLLKKKLIDYLALDFKAPLDGRYGKIVRVEDFDPVVWETSLKLILASKVTFELRTTIVPGLHDKKILSEMAKQLKSITESCLWFWQSFRPKRCLDPTFEEKKPYEKEQLEEFLKTAKRYYPLIQLRNY